LGDRPPTPTIPTPNENHLDLSNKLLALSDTVPVSSETVPTLNNKLLALGDKLPVSNENGLGLNNKFLALSSTIPPLIQTGPVSNKNVPFHTEDKCDAKLPHAADHYPDHDRPAPWR